MGWTTHEADVAQLPFGSLQFSSLGWTWTTHSSCVGTAGCDGGDESVMHFKGKCLLMQCCSCRFSVTFNKSSGDEAQSCVIGYWWKFGTDPSSLFKSDFLNLLQTSTFHINTCLVPSDAPTPLITDSLWRFAPVGFRSDPFPLPSYRGSDQTCICVSSYFLPFRSAEVEPTVMFFISPPMFCFLWRQSFVLLSSSLASLAMPSFFRPMGAHLMGDKSVWLTVIKKDAGKLWWCHLGLATLSFTAF